MDLIKKCNILYIEDDIIIYKNLTRILSNFCNKVFFADTKDKAIDIYKNEKIDIIITDIELLQSNGLDLAQEIREDNFLLPIIVITSHLDIKYLKQAVTIGLVEYIEKPISYDKIINVLQKTEKWIQKHNLLLPQLGNDLLFDMKSQSLIYNNTTISLTKKEALFLELLYKNKNKIVTKDTIFYTIWDKNLNADENNLKNLLFRLRKKLPQKDMITSIPDIGCMLCID